MGDDAQLENLGANYVSIGTLNIEPPRQLFRSYLSSEPSSLNL